MTFRNRLILVFGAALCIFLVIGALSYERFLEEDTDHHWIAHTQKVLEQLDTSLSASIQLNEEERTFLQGQNRAYPAAALQAGRELQLQVAEINTLTADNPTQQSATARLTDLVNARTSFLPRLQLETGTGLSPGQEETRRQLSTQIRNIFLEMRAEEERLLGERLQRATGKARQMKYIVGIGYAFSLLLFAFAVYSIAGEIEKRKKSEERMRRAQEQYRLLFDSNPIPVWVYDLETLAIVDVNKVAISRYGYSREEFLRCKITDIRPGEDIPSLLESVYKEGGIPQDSGPWRHRKKSGELIDVQIRSFPLKFEGRSARLVVATDITDKKRAEDALRLSEERLRMILSNIKDYSVITLEPDGLISSWNGAAERINGYRADEVVGKHMSIFYTPDETAIGKPTIELATAIEWGRFEDDGWRVRKDGSRFFANVVVTPLQDHAGHVRGFLKITRDITEKRKVEQELLRRSAELETANKELESFSYSVSHDLRAPLRGIDGFSQALQEDYSGSLDATGKNYLSRIRAGTKRMGNLIDDLLNLARVTRAEMHRETINLSKMAAEIVKELEASEPHRSVTVQIDKGLAANCDSRLVRIVLQNLLGNSWKFTAKRTDARLEFRALTSNGLKGFLVRDNGAGFDRTYAARLFGAFQRLHAMEEFPGSGIGLATVQRIIHRHGGKVWAEGAVNQGATVYFTLEPDV